MSTPRKFTWNADLAAVFATLAEEGRTQKEIAAAMKMNVGTLRTLIYRDGPTFRAWEKAKPARYREFQRQAAERKQAAELTRAIEDGGGPISDELRNLGLAALAAMDARRKAKEAERQLEEDAAVLSLACESCASGDRLCIVDVADALQWPTSRAYRAARLLFDRGRFPYVLTAREGPEQDSDIPALTHEEIAAAVEEIKAEEVAWKRTQRSWRSRDKQKCNTNSLVGVRDTVTLHAKRYDGKPWEEAKAVKRLAIQHGWAKPRPKQRQSQAA